MADKEEDVFMAKLAEQAERYEEMVEYMKKVANTGVRLESEERNLLSVAYKNVIGSRRASWRIVSTLEQKEEDNVDSNPNKLEVIKNFRSKIESELKDICNDILQLLEDRLIAKDITKIEDDRDEIESQVFYMKMKGDYKRYIAEFSTKEERKVAAEESLLGYSMATGLAERVLDPTNPIRLGLALNFSVFYYEILSSPALACKLAKTVFDEAIHKLDRLGEDKYKDSSLIMQLLRDNLTLWTEMDGAGNGGGQEQTNLQDVEDEDVENEDVENEDVENEDVLNQ